MFNTKENIIGSIEYDENGEIKAINRGKSEQGYIYKNPNAFAAKEGICYIPELNDSTYTYTDFLSLAENDEKIATMIFESVDWQEPETYVDECFRENELNHCPKCGKIYMSYGKSLCDTCITEKYTKQFIKNNITQPDKIKQMIQNIIKYMLTQNISENEIKAIFDITLYD